MKFGFTALVVFASLIFSSCGSSKKAVQPEQAINQVQNPSVKEITVDGNDADWQGVALYSSPLKTFEYSVAHNDEDLFVRMKILNPLEQMKFLTAGMELWIDPTGQEKQKVEVVYPVKGELATTAMQPQNSSADKKQNRDLMHLSVRAQVVSMNRIGFKPEYSGTQTISENTGFKAAINWNETDELIYELKIPLKAFNGTVSANHMALEFSIGALERPAENHERGENGGGSRQGGMAGGMRGGGAGGNHGGGGGRYGGGGERRSTQSGDTKTDWSKMREKESFWVQFS
ncbi:MAG: hypothetical protein ACXVLT_08010 [Flavisolibacter sp.]